MESRSIGPAKARVVAASLLAFAQLVLALSMKPSYPLTAFGDTSQCILLLGALLSVIPIAKESKTKRKCPSFDCINVTKSKDTTSASP